MQMYINEVLNSLKTNPFTIVRGDVGIGKSKLIVDIAKENNFQLCNIGVIHLSNGDLDKLEINIQQDTIILIDDMDKACLSIYEEINRFIYRIKNINSEFNVYICGTVSNKHTNMENMLYDINYKVVNFGIDVNDFIKYMGNHLVPEIKDFLKNNPEYFHTANTTPRMWSNLSIYLKSNKKSNKKSNINLIKDISQHFIGDDVKKELINFIVK